MNKVKPDESKQTADAKTKAGAEGAAATPAAPGPKIKVDVLAGVKRVLAANLGLTQEEREELDLSDVIDNDNVMGMDELDRVEVMFGLEEEFDIDLTDDEFLQARTIGGLVKVIEGKIKS